jgi:hypothetical protein
MKNTMKNTIMTERKQKGAAATMGQIMCILLSGDCQSSVVAGDRLQ